MIDEGESGQGERGFKDRSEEPNTAASPGGCSCARARVRDLAGGCGAPRMEVYVITMVVLDLPPCESCKAAWLASLLSIDT